MKPSRRGPAVLLLLAVCTALGAACGKKGPPLAPLARIPATPGDPQAARFGDDVYVWFTVPSTTVSGESPAGVTAIKLYAVTASAPPSGATVLDRLEPIATYVVQPPAPPPVPVPDGQAAPALPAVPGFAPGTVAVVRERLTPELRQAAPLDPVADVDAAQAEPEAPPAGPLVAPPETAALRRHYFLVAVGRGGRESAPTAALSVPMGDASDPPTGLEVEYTDQAMTLSWTASANARAVPPAADPALLPSRPIVAPASPTGYHVFEVPPAGEAPSDPYALTLPAALTSQPLAGTTFEIPGGVGFGTERCFTVRAVDAVGGATTVGRAAAPACVVPVDTFPPAAPRQLAAIAGIGVINLIWEANTEADLAGYLVLRGTAEGGTLQALTPSPIRETTYRDQSVTAGVRYVYAVVAVDTASPQNVSGQSNRVEETSRTP